MPLENLLGYNIYLTFVWYWKRLLRQSFIRPWSIRTKVSPEWPRMAAQKSNELGTDPAQIMGSIPGLKWIFLDWANIICGLKNTLPIFFSLPCTGLAQCSPLPPSAPGQELTEHRLELTNISTSFLMAGWSTKDLFHVILKFGWERKQTD